MQFQVCIPFALFCVVDGALNGLLRRGIFIRIEWKERLVFKWPGNLNRLSSSKRPYAEENAFDDSWLFWLLFEERASVV
jgi:hypothetical protein